MLSGCDIYKCINQNFPFILFESLKKTAVLDEKHHKKKIKQNGSAE